MQTLKMTLPKPKVQLNIKRLNGIIIRHQINVVNVLFYEQIFSLFLLQSLSYFLNAPCVMRRLVCFLNS